MGQHYSYRRSSSKDDTAMYMRDYNASLKIKKILVRLSMVLLLILFCTGFLLTDYIGEELAMIMMVAPVILMLIWFLVAYFYKGEPPPTFDPPIDINAEFGKQYFQPPEVIEKEEALSRISRITTNTSMDESVIKVVD